MLCLQQDSTRDINVWVGISTGTGHLVCLNWLNIENFWHQPEYDSTVTAAGLWRNDVYVIIISHVEYNKTGNIITSAIL
jgi:hypothetical protein